MSLRRRALGFAMLVATVTAACGSTVPRSDFTSSGARPLGEGASLGEAVDTPAAGDGDEGLASATGRASARAGNNNTAVTRSLGSAAQPVRTTGPIKIGVLYTVNDGAESAGVDNGNTFSASEVAHAFVESYNSTGGVGGRRIDPVYAELHSASNDYEGQIAAVCATFTEDNRVAAVLSNLGYYSENLLACLAEAAVPLISGDWAAPDQEDAKRFPLFITPVTLLGDDRVIAVVSHLKASGFLQARNRIGVVIEGCPIDQRIFRNSLAPAIQRAGLNLVSTFEPRCFQSLQDYGAQASEIQNAVLQFNADRIDRVVFVSQAAEANIMNLFSQGADAQRYFPGYALSSIAAPAVLALNAPAAQLANAQGVGWLPSVDTQNRQQAPPTSTAIRCNDRMKAKGILPTSSADLTTVYGACDVFTLYDALLQSTNGDASAAAIVRALPAVAGSYVSASTVGGRVAMRAGRISAAAGRRFAFLAGKGFEYTSDPFAL